MRQRASVQARWLWEPTAHSRDVVSTDKCSLLALSLCPWFNSVSTAAWRVLPTDQTRRESHQKSHLGSGYPLHLLHWGSFLPSHAQEDRTGGSGSAQTQGCRALRGFRVLGHETTGHSGDLQLSYKSAASTTGDTHPEPRPSENRGQEASESGERRTAVRWGFAHM